MNRLNPERKSSTESHESDIAAFEDKFRDLLPGVEFEEPSEILEARIAILEALTRGDQNPDFLKSVWIEYTKVCEHVVDNKTLDGTDPHTRSKLQVATLVHKALIFRKSGDIQRYSEELTDAEEYAFNARLDEIADAIGRELDNLTD